MKGHVKDTFLDVVKTSWSALNTLRYSKQTGKTCAGYRMAPGLAGEALPVMVIGQG